MSGAVPSDILVVPQVDLPARTMCFQVTSLLRFRSEEYHVLVCPLGGGQTGTQRGLWSHTVHAPQPEGCPEPSCSAATSEVSQSAAWILQPPHSPAPSALHLV